MYLFMKFAPSQISINVIVVDDALAHRDKKVS